MSTGNYLDNQRTPQVGDQVWTLLLRQVDDRQFVVPVQGEVSLVSNIDNRGLANTYVDVVCPSIGGRRLHVSISRIFDHEPQLVEVEDEYGKVKVWR